MNHAVRNDSEPRAIVARARVVVLCLVALMPFAYALGVAMGRVDRPTVREYEAAVSTPADTCVRSDEARAQ